MVLKIMFFFAAKLYPANSTTNSNHGVKKIENLYKIFESMQDFGMPLLIHGEVTDSEVDVFDREEVFIDKELSQITKRFPKLKNRSRTYNDLLCSGFCSRK